MGERTWQGLGALAVVLGAAGLAVGQGVSPTPTGPQPLPVRPVVPGTLREELGIDRSPALLREGAFVSSARGVPAKGKSGRWYVVFDEDARGRKMPPMVVLPSQYLAAMERIASRMSGEEATRARIMVTGQVMAYQGHNYLLPTAPPILETTIPSTAPEVPIAEQAQETPQPETPQPETRQPDAEHSDIDQPNAEEPGDASVPATPSPTPADGPSIERIIGELDRALGTRRVTNPTTAADREAGAAEVAASGGTPAGTRPAGFMTGRRGRVMRMGGGEAVFVVDTGTVSEVAEPPMTLLPCTNLSMIEALAERMGESATFTISGQVTVYQGRNYLLATTFTVNRKSDQVIPNQ